MFSSGRGGKCWGEWVTGLGLGFTNSGGTSVKWDKCVFWLWWCGWSAWDRVCEGGVVLCLDFMC